MKKLSKVQSPLILIILFAVLFMFSENSFPQNISERDEAIPDSVISRTVNNFLNALNSGERDAMQEFIVHSYDENVLKRVPIYSVISLNMAFYYETGGLGYKLHSFLPAETNQITSEIYNKLTETYAKLTIPVSKAPAYKINWFIKTEPMQPTTSGKQVKRLSDIDIVKRLEILLKKLDEDEEFSGTVLVAKDENVLFEKAIGEASKSYNVLNKTDTKFNLASLGKMFTGTAITQLVEKGKISFDDPIGKYVSADWLNPEISNKIQIRHLLTHTSGLGDYFRDAYLQSAVPIFRDLDDYKSLIADDTLSFEPGTKFSYSNTGMLLLGVIIENVTGEDYFDYLKKNIFEPAGMVNTGGFYKDRPVENRATGYSKIYENGKVTWDNHQFTRIMRGSPSGGIYSTIEDMLKFDIALRSDKLLSHEYTKILFEERPELNVSFHSYGFFISKSNAGRVASHKGDGRGVNCQFKMFLDSGYTVVVLSNYSQPSANIVANVIDQLITATSDRTE
jgi:CubicO group peptidase (beta-lactamase class C family)